MVYWKYACQRPQLTSHGKLKLKQGRDPVFYHDLTSLLNLQDIAMNTSAVNLQQKKIDKSSAREPRPKVALFDCWQTDTEIVLSGDFPGVSSDKLEIEFHEQILTIKGSSANDNGSETLVRSEFEGKSLERSFRVHEEINADGIEASFDNAVLTVVLPIVQPIAPRRIAISTP